MFGFVGNKGSVASFSPAFGSSHIFFSITAASFFSFFILGLGGLGEVSNAQEMSIAQTDCQTQYLKKEAAAGRNSVCVRTMDDAFSTEERVGQAAMRHVGMGFSQFDVATERRCDCEFALGRYDINPKKSWTDKLAWKRWYCKKFISKDGPNCGSTWISSNEGFRPFICNPAEGHTNCAEGELLALMRNPGTDKRERVPISACAEADPLPRADGKPAKDLLVLIIDAHSIPTYKDVVNGCIKLTIRKDIGTKQISFFGSAFNHPIEEVQTHPLIRGILNRKQQQD